MFWQPNLKSSFASMHKTALMEIGKKDYESIQSLNEQAVMKQETKIIADFQHALFSEYEPLPSGRRLCVPTCKSNGLKLSFIPASIKLLSSTKSMCNKYTSTLIHTASFYFKVPCCQCQMSLMF